MDEKTKAYVLKITKTVIKWMPACLVVLYWICIVAFMKGVFIPVFDEGVEFEYAWNNTQCTVMMLMMVLIYIGLEMNKRLKRR